MAQLDQDRYKRLTSPKTYAQSDGLYYDTTNGRPVWVKEGTVYEIPLQVASQVSGDLLRRGASEWARLPDLTDDVTIDSAGVATIGAGKVTAAMLAASIFSGDVTVNGSGVTAIGATKVLASMLGANLAKGHIPLSTFTARIISANEIQDTTEAGIPDGNTAGPRIDRINAATDKGGRLIWAATEVNELQFEPFAYPGDLDDTAALTFHMIAAMAGVSDTPTVGVAYFEGVGDTDAGGNTGAVTGTTPTEYTRTIAAGDIGAHPNFASIVLTPAAHGTDALYIYAAWVEYNRKS